MNSEQTTDDAASAEAAADLLATVVILTFNGERYIGDILGALSVQTLDGEFEVLIIDSGSSDSTLSIVAKYPDVRLVQIPNHEFGHGRTRNLAANLARGRYVVFLTHDAVPSHAHWLYEMLKPFELNPKVAAVMGKQIPRPWCFPLLKYEIRAVFDGFGPGFGTSYFYDDYFVDSRGLKDAIGFYSDVNSAARREILVGDVPYRDVPYAEDQLFGRDVLDHGFVKAYAPRGSVVHSNDMTLAEYDNRMFDETVGLRRVGIEVDRPDLPTCARLILRGSVRDASRILRDREYSLKRRLYFLAVNPAYHVQRWRGVRRGAAVRLDDAAQIESMSLEAQRRTLS